MQELFITTRDLLMDMANATGLSYKEVNVLVWYFLIPFTWAVLLDMIIGRHRGKLVVGLLCLIVGFLMFALGWTEPLFDRSCEFLLDSGVGGSYRNASVIVCLFVPVVIYAMMIPWAAFVVWRRRRRATKTPSFKN